MGRQYKDYELEKNKKDLARIQGYLNNPKLNQKDKEVLTEYLAYQRSREKVKVGSIVNMVQNLVYFFVALREMEINARIEEVTRKEINLYYNNPIHEGTAKNTKVLRNVYLKQFWSWYFEEKKIEFKGKFPEAVSHLSSSRERNKLQENDLLTREEVKKMIAVCKKHRDKALISMLYDTGGRISELLTVNIGSITFPKQSGLHYAEIKLNGKTGQRTCVIIESYPHLMNYLNSEHGYADDLNAPLFLNSSNKDFGERLLYQGAFSTIKTAGKRAGIGGWGWEYLPGGKRKWKHLWGKNLHPHLFRHSRATELAGKSWCEPELRQQFGWREYSSMPTTYVHLASDAVKKRMLKEHGIEESETNREEKREELMLRPKECVVCGASGIPSTALACHCGAILSIGDLAKIKELKVKTDTFERNLKELPLRSELIKQGMNNHDYKKELIKNDPFLRAEFEKIAKEILATITSRQDQVQEKKLDFDEKEVLELRKYGWSMHEIAEKLGYDYRIIRGICQKHGVSKSLPI